MTCVVGLRGAGRVVLAADAQATMTGSGPTFLKSPATAKTARLSETVAIATCGSPRVHQVLRYHVTLPDLPVAEDAHEWAVKKFINSCRSALKESGALRTSEGVESADGPSAFLLAVRDRLFHVFSDFQVLEDDRPYAALGSGADLARGHFESLGFASQLPGEDVDLVGAAVAAVKTAIARNAYVGGRVDHVETTRWSKSERELAESICAQ